MIIIGFSFSFIILFRKNDRFKDPLDSFSKTIVMMMGEFDYNDLFNLTSVDNSTDYNYDDLDRTNDILNSILTRVVFVIFPIVINIVFMNLTIGLVISDVQALKEEVKSLIITTERP